MQHNPWTASIANLLAAKATPAAILGLFTPCYSNLQTRISPLPPCLVFMKSEAGSLLYNLFVGPKGSYYHSLFFS